MGRLPGKTVMDVSAYSSVGIEEALPTRPEGRPVPTISQDPSLDGASRDKRALDLALARTAYNYTLSYLPSVPLSADEPKGEEFTLAYQAHLVEPFLEIAENFVTVVMTRLGAELEGDLEGLKILEEVRKDIDAAKEQLSGLSKLNLVKDLEAITELAECLSRVPEAIEKLIAGLSHIPGDLRQVATGLAAVFKQVPAEGATAFLKSTLSNVLRDGGSSTYLRAQSFQDYDELFPCLEKPDVMRLPTQDWMQLPAGTEPWQQDWFFGYMQIAGFNTTNLQRVTDDRTTRPMAISLPDLLAKCPLTDEVLQRATGDATATLQGAVDASRLYAVDYVAFEGADADVVHGEQRFVCAPIAVFYWNPSPPPGFPPGGALQPVAIQLGQKHDPEAFPLFEPGDGLGWQVAKHYVQWACGVQHEAVAHFGACHATMDALVIAAHRQLAPEHPIMVLLTPHFRFTIAINDSALHSLIVPGGTVATVLSASIESTMALIQQARAKWRFDACSPPALFDNRGVDDAHLPHFPFRDDTLLLWKAIEKWVRAYLSVYYESNDAVRDDAEVQAWVNELASPWGAAVPGMDGLTSIGTPEAPRYRCDTFDYLVQLVAQTIYLGGPQHAAVNYAQYPLMSYLPSVSGSLYAPPPKRGDEISMKTLLDSLPPLDVGLYQAMFSYLLSAVQYDVLGHYSENPRKPYFADPRVREAELDFVEDLAAAEAVIRKRNKGRALPYVYQLPSMVPNSISI